MPVPVPVPVPARIELWHRALGAVRGHFLSEGLREVTTPVRLEAVAIEPFIEPIPSGDHYLATSPELPMKQLVAHGSGPIFQIAPVFRRGEVGDRHREEFRLVEWYRLDPDPSCVRADVEVLVEVVADAVADFVESPRSPVVWETHRWLDLFASTTGVELRGDEDAAELEAKIVETRPELWFPPDELPRVATRRGRTLLAWTALFTTWSDQILDPWLSKRAGVHLLEFPRPLAALARLEGDVTSARFESHVAGLELANGYGELLDPQQQEERFETVAELRDAFDQPPLPMPHDFLQVLREPGLPPCSGAALGLDRLLMWAAGADALIPLR